MKSACITADILACLSDGKVHSAKEIAGELEICRNTVYRHIHALSVRFPISTFYGGRNHGGSILYKEYMFQGRIYSKEEITLINTALEAYQKTDQCENPALLARLIELFKPFKN